MSNKTSVIGFVVLLSLAACKKDPITTVPPPVPPVENNDKVNTGLKEIVWQGLPSPYYYFEYNDSNYISRASFLSGKADYEVSHSQKRISLMQNQNPVNKTRLQYVYADGKVSLVKFLNEAGQTFKRSFLTYGANDQLSRIDWEIAIPKGGFAQARTMTFTYAADGNLLELTNQQNAIEGVQPAYIFIDRFEDYDNKMNTDGFSLMHPSEDHLVLLPSIKLQKNNARIVTRSGDGVHYRINYQYSYDANGRPTQKTGDMLFLSGTDQGKHFFLNISLTYY